MRGKCDISRGYGDNPLLFRIFRVYDDATPRGKRLIESVIALTRKQFPGEKRRVIERIPKTMRDPVSKKLRAVLFVATGGDEEVLGFALLYHSTNPDFCYLDYLATLPSKMGRGIGSALYERLREECSNLGSRGLFFECLPDDNLFC